MITFRSRPWGWAFFALVSSGTLVLSAYRTVGIEVAGTQGDARVGVARGEFYIGRAANPNPYADSFRVVWTTNWDKAALLNWRPYHVAEGPIGTRSSYRYVHVPLWLIALPASLFTVYLWTGWVATRAGLSRCTSCGYSTTGLTPVAGAVVCPECGHRSPCERPANGPGDTPSANSAIQPATAPYSCVGPNRGAIQGTQRNPADRTST